MSFMKKVMRGAFKVASTLLEGYTEPHKGPRPDHSNDPDQQLINDQLWAEQRDEQKRKTEMETEYTRYIEECLLDLRQIALAAAKRGFRDKRSYHGYTLVIAHGCARMWKGGEQLTEEQKRQVPLVVLRKFRTHFNHLVVPA